MVLEAKALIFAGVAVLLVMSGFVIYGIVDTPRSTQAGTITIGIGLILCLLFLFRQYII